MQTFLPYPSFAHSVACLDRARLGKQRLECAQILTALRRMSDGETREEIPWGSHPAVLMWRGYESALALYQTLAVREWEARGYCSTTETSYTTEGPLALRPEYATLYAAPEHAAPPPWLGDERLHRSHRAMLLRKMPRHYGAFEWMDVESEYWWPTEHEIFHRCRTGVDC